MDASGGLDTDLLRDSRDEIPDLNLNPRLQLFGRSPGQSGGTYAADNDGVMEIADAGVCELVLGNVCMGGPALSWNVDGPHAFHAVACCCTLEGPAAGILLLRPRKPC